MPTAILPIAPVKADTPLSTPSSIQAFAPVKTAVSVSFPTQTVNSDVPVSSSSELLLPDTDLLSLCFQFIHKEIFSWLRSSKLLQLLEFPKDFDPRMSLLPILHDHTVDTTWVLYNTADFDTMDQAFPLSLLNFLTNPNHYPNLSSLFSCFTTSVQTTWLFDP